MATMLPYDATSCVSVRAYQEVVRAGGLESECNAAHAFEARSLAARHIIERQTLHELTAPKKHIDAAPTRLGLGQWTDVHRCTAAATRIQTT